MWFKQRSANVVVDITIFYYEAASVVASLQLLANRRYTTALSRLSWIAIGSTMLRQSQPYSANVVAASAEGIPPALSNRCNFCRSSLVRNRRSKLLSFS